MNTSTYNWILYFISATIVITVGVQVYWNYKNFELNRQRVTNEIQLSLDNAIEEYYAGLAKTDFLTIIETDSHPHEQSGFALEKTEIKINTSQHKNDPEKVDSLLVSVGNQMTESLFLEKKNGIIDSISGFTQFDDSGQGVTVMKPDISMSVQVLKGKKAYDSIKLLKNLKPILIALDRDSLEYEKIDSLLLNQLDGKGIALSFHLKHTKNDTMLNGTLKDIDTERFLFVKSKSTYLKPSEEIGLLYQNPFNEALKRSSFGILLSFLLASAIVSCLFYLLRIIKNQKQLAEVKNDLISNITHEFKTPIATIGVALESIKDFEVIKDKAKTTNYLNMSSEQLSKLNTMVEKLLETATLDSDELHLNIEETNLSKLLSALVDKHRLHQEEKSITFHSSEDMILGNVDAFHFENSINNLMDNAIKYGGTNIQVHLKKNLDAILISVSDDGNELNSANKERIFEKFYRVPKGNTHDVKGFGIGLYYTKKIIEKHGGTIHLDLKNNQTSFNITIPNE